MSDENTNAGPVVDGERTIASVTAEKTGRGSGDTQKLIVLGSIIIGVAVFAYFGWPREEAPTNQPVQTEDTRIRTTTQFQPASLLLRYRNRRHKLRLLTPLLLGRLNVSDVNNPNRPPRPLS